MLTIPVHLPTMADTDYQDYQPFVLNLVNNAIVSNTQTIEPLLSCERLGSRRAGGIIQGVNPALNSPLHDFGQFAELAQRGREDLNLIGHLKAQFALGLGPGDGLFALLLGVRKCSLGRCEV